MRFRYLDLLIVVIVIIYKHIFYKFSINNELTYVGIFWKINCKCNCIICNHKLQFLKKSLFST